MVRCLTCGCGRARISSGEVIKNCGLEKSGLGLSIVLGLGLELGTAATAASAAPHIPVWVITELVLS